MIFQEVQGKKFRMKKRIEKKFIFPQTKNAYDPRKNETFSPFISRQNHTT